MPNSRDERGGSVPQIGHRRVAGEAGHLVTGSVEPRAYRLQILLERDERARQAVAVLAGDAELFEVAAFGFVALARGDGLQLPEQSELGLQPRAILLEAVGQVVIVHAAPRTVVSAGALAMLTQLSRRVWSTRMASSSGVTELSLAASSTFRLANP